MITRLFFTSMCIIAIAGTQLLCGITSAPERLPAKSSDVEIQLVKKPEILRRGETGVFAVKTSPKNTCIGAIGYQDTIKDEWITLNLGDLEANAYGFCEWTWTVPREAENGIAEFRVAAEEKGKYGYLMPQSFCVEACPWE